MQTLDRNSPAWLVGTSAEDCSITMQNRVASSPMGALSDVAGALDYMNANGIEKKAHRQALMKAGRAALKKLGEM
jgi:hypothetical protein